MQSSFRRLSTARLRIGLMAGTALTVFSPHAALAGQAPATQPEQVIIEGDKAGDYKPEVPSLTKLTEPLVDTPQTIDVITIAPSPI